MKRVLLIGTATPMRKMLHQELLSQDYHVSLLEESINDGIVYKGKLLAHKGAIPKAGSIATLGKTNDVAVVTCPSLHNDMTMYDELILRYSTIIDELDNSSIERLVIVGGGGHLPLPDGTPLMQSKYYSLQNIPYFKALETIYLQLKRSKRSFDWLFMVPPEVMVHGEKTKQIRYSNKEILCQSSGYSIISMEDFAYALVNELEEGKFHEQHLHTAY